MQTGERLKMVELPRKGIPSSKVQDMEPKQISQEMYETKKKRRAEFIEELFVYYDAPPLKIKTTTKSCDTSDWCFVNQSSSQVLFIPTGAKQMLCICRGSWLVG